MPVDSSIALGIRPPQFADPMAQYANVLAIQNAGNQNALSQYTLARAKRDDEDTNALRRELAGVGSMDSPEGLRAAQNALLRVGRVKEAQELGKSALDARNVTSQIGERDLNAGIKAMGQYRDVLGEVTSPQKAAQWLQAQYNDPLVGPVVSRMRPLSAAIAAIPTDPQGFQEWVQKSALGMDKFITENKPQLSTRDMGGVVQDRTFQPLTGTLNTLGTTAKTATIGEQETARHNPIMEGIARGNLGVAQGNLGVAQNNLGISNARLNWETGQSIPTVGGGGGGIVPSAPSGMQGSGPSGSRPNVIQTLVGAPAAQQPAQAQPADGLTPKQRSEMSAANIRNAPAVASQVQSAFVKANVVSDKVQEAIDLINKKPGATTGLGGAVMSYIPGNIAYDVDQAISSVKANIGFKELQAMREASPTGGALGQVAVQELEFLQAALGSLKQGQSPDILKRNLTAVRTHFNNWRDAVKKSYEQTYGQKSPADNPMYDDKTRTTTSRSSATVSNW